MSKAQQSPVTISAGAAVTAGIPVPEGMVLVGVVWPSAMDQATFTIQNSATQTGTYVNVIGAVGLSLTVSTQYALSRLVTEGLQNIKILMPGNETAARSLSLVWAPRT